tara:strand:+ start:9717 stop:10496 length:780 start_codon:yes stop_codon:yes gene_type:complete
MSNYNFSHLSLPPTADPCDACAIVREHGVCIIRQAISSKMAVLLDNIVMELEYTEIFTHNRNSIVFDKLTQRVGRLIIKAPVFIELLTHPLILEIWHSYLSTRMVCSSFASHSLLPSYNRYAWHRDFPYWIEGVSFPSSPLAVQTLWVLSDFSPENGATAFLRGSHINNVDVSVHLQHDEQIIATATPGDAILFDARTYHTARPNTTSQRRRCILVSYIQPFVTPMEDMRGQLSKIQDPSQLVSSLLAASARHPVDIHT